MLKLLAISLVLLLAACGDDHPATPVDRIVTVSVPVAVQPIKPSDIPPLPLALGPRPPTLQQQADTLLAAHCDDVAFIIKAYPLLMVSAGLAPAQAPDFPECAQH